MDILSILKQGLEGRKILSHEKDAHGHPMNNIMTIHSIDGLSKGVMECTVVIHPLDRKRSDPIYGYKIDLDNWRFETINND